MVYRRTLIRGEVRTIMVRRRRTQKRVKVEDITGFFEEFNRESDRGAAIIGAAMLDERLRQLMGAFLVDDSTKVDQLLEGPLAPLGSFASRIGTSYCLGLISKDEYHDLQIVREIRNVFAHELHGLSFSDARVKDKCTQLHLPKELPPLPGGPPGARNPFMGAVALLWLRLGVRTLRQQHQVVPGGFPVVETVQ